MRATSADRLSEVSGPVAMISGYIAGLGNAQDLFARDGNERMRVHGLRDRTREAFAVDGERRAGRHPVGIGRPHDERAEPPHLLLEEADGVIELVTAQRIGANELGELIGLVHRSGAHRPHFVQRPRARRATRPAKRPHNQRDRHR